MKRRGEPPPRTDVCCALCGKTKEQVRRLIAGPMVFICDECVRLCVDILAAEIDEPPAPPAGAPPPLLGLARQAR